MLTQTASDCSIYICLIATGRVPSFGVVSDTSRVMFREGTMPCSSAVLSSASILARFFEESAMFEIALSDENKDMHGRGPS